MTKPWILSFAAVSAFASAAAYADETPAETEVAASEESEEESEGLDLPVNLSASLSGRMPVGTLSFRDSYTVTNYFLSTIGLGVSRSIGEGMSVGLNMSASKYLSEHSFSREHIRDGRFNDMSLSFNHGSVVTIPGADINVSAGASATLPTSPVSRFMGLRTTLSTNLGLSRTFGKVSVSYGLGVSENFYRGTSPVFGSDRYDVDVFIRPTGQENVAEGLVALAGYNTQFSVSNSFNVGVSIIEGLSGSIGLSYGDAFSYRVNRDDHEEYGDLSSEFAQDRPRHHGQSVTGTLGVRYSFLDHFGAGLSLATSSMPKQADNTGLRFPWWDFATGNQQYTAVGLSLSANY